MISASLNSLISALLCSFAFIFFPSSSEINHICLEVFNMIPHNLHGWLGSKNSLTGHKTKTCAPLLSKSSFLSPSSSLIKTVVKISPCSGTPYLILGQVKVIAWLGKATKGKKGLSHLSYDWIRLVVFKLFYGPKQDFCPRAIQGYSLRRQPAVERAPFGLNTSQCTIQPEHQPVHHSAWTLASAPLSLNSELASAPLGLNSKLASAPLGLNSSQCTTWPEQQTSQSPLKEDPRPRQAGLKTSKLGKVHKFVSAGFIGIRIVPLPVTFLQIILLPIWAPFF